MRRAVAWLNSGFRSFYCLRGLATGNMPASQNIAATESNDEPPMPIGSNRSFPSSLPPQLVISWLPVRGGDVASALCASSAWHRTSAATFQIIAQSRGLGRERADVPWSEVVRCSKRRVAVLDPGRRYPCSTRFARALGVLEQGWVPEVMQDRPEVLIGDVGDFISEIEGLVPNRGLDWTRSTHIIAFRADRDGAIHIIGRTAVLMGYPGELGTVNLTAADVETLGVSELKKELAARGLKTTGREAGLERRLRARLHEYFERRDPVHPSYVND